MVLAETDRAVDAEECESTEGPSPIPQAQLSEAVFVARIWVDQAGKLIAKNLSFSTEADMRLVHLMRAGEGSENPRAFVSPFFSVAVVSGMGSACVCLFSLAAASCLLQAGQHWEGCRWGTAPPCAHIWPLCFTDMKSKNSIWFEPDIFNCKSY